MSQTQTQDIPQLMTVNEVASYLRVSRNTVVSLTKRGEIPATVVGRQYRFRRDAVVGYVA